MCLRDEDPAQWTGAVETRSGTWHDDALGMAEFLVELVSGRVSPPLNAHLTIDPAPSAAPLAVDGLVAGCGIAARIPRIRS